MHLWMFSPNFRKRRVQTTSVWLWRKRVTVLANRPFQLRPHPNYLPCVRSYLLVTCRKRYRKYRKNENIPQIQRKINVILIYLFKFLLFQSIRIILTTRWGDSEHPIIFASGLWSPFHFCWGDFDHYVFLELRGLWSRGFDIHSSITWITWKYRWKFTSEYI